MNTEPKHNNYYLYRTHYTYRERIVGLFVCLAIVLFLVFITFSVKNQHLFEKRVIFHFTMNSSEGVSRGTIVRALGTEIGRVSDMSYSQEGKIKVVIEVYEGRHALIRQGSRIVVNRLTGIGDALIEIKSASFTAPILPAGTTIPVDETASLNDLLLSIAHLIQTIDSKKLLIKFDVMLPKLEQTLANAHTIIAQVASGHGTLGAAVFDKQVERNLRVVVKSGADILTETQSIITIAKQRLAQIKPILKDTHFVVNDMREASQNMPQLIKQLHKAITQINTSLALINGELNDATGMTAEAKQALSKTHHLLDSIQNTWPLSDDAQPANQQTLVPVHSNHE